MTTKKGIVLVAFLLALSPFAVKAGTAIAKAVALQLAQSNSCPIGSGNEGLWNDNGTFKIRHADTTDTAIAQSILNEYMFDVVEDSLTANVELANITLGNKMMFNQPATITGVKFVYPDSTSRSVLVSVWDDTDTQVATTTANISGAGVHTINLSSPVTVSGAHCKKPYIITIRDTGGTSYWTITTPSYWPRPPYLAGPNVIMLDYMFASAGGEPAASLTPPDYRVPAVLPVLTVP